MTHIGHRDEVDSSLWVWRHDHLNLGNKQIESVSVKVVASHSMVLRILERRFWQVKVRCGQ
jgi:hypothetical protein